MKHFYLSILTVLLLACGGSDSQVEDEVVEEDEPKSNVTFDYYNQKISYCIGLDHAKGCYNAYTAKGVVEYFDIQEIENGMIDYLAGNDLKIQPWEKDSLMDAYLGEDGVVYIDVMSAQDAGYCAGMDEAFIMISGLVGRKIDQEVDVEYILMGIKEGFANMKYPAVSYFEARQEVEKYYADVNKKNGQDFLAENRLIKGVIETKTGLQYEVIKEGLGVNPNLTDSVVFHYTGRFIDGRVFDSTIPGKIPYRNSLINLISGQQEGLMLMKEGGQARFYIPPYLAYGDKPYGAIEANSTLVFDIELIKVIRYSPE